MGLSAALAVVLPFEDGDVEAHIVSRGLIKIQKAVVVVICPSAKTIT